MNRNCELQSRRRFTAFTALLVSTLAPSSVANAQYPNSGMGSAISTMSGQNSATQGSVPRGAVAKETVRLTLRDPLTWLSTITLEPVTQNAPQKISTCALAGPALETARK